jgi:ABC-type antimicrobial peptide transport system permease subunit
MASSGDMVAIGASSADVIGLVLGEGMWLAASGVTIGIIAARALTSLAVSLLYRVEPTDLVSFAAAGWSPWGRATCRRDVRAGSTPGGHTPSAMV